MRGEIKREENTDSVQITLDLNRGTARSETLLRGTEFPRVAAADIGNRYRQLFATTCHSTPGFGMTGVARIDVESGHVDRFEYGSNWLAEEHIPVRKASGKGQWLIGPAYDVKKRQTVLVVFDGAHLAHGPVARARLQYAAPLCFHGNFLAA
jgi:carotenoid cleavage dioxygenase